jgi:peptide/nickel transport system substrate-binding protein
MDVTVRFPVRLAAWVGLIGLAVAAPLAPGVAGAAPARILVVASGQDASNIDPHTGYDYAIRAIQRNLYDALLKYQGNPPVPVPWLAERYTASPDGTEFTFSLRKDAKFRDGSPVTAQAVQFSFNRMLKHRKGVSWMYTAVMNEQSVQVVNETTVRIKLTKPFAPFLSVVPWLWIANPKVVKEREVGGDDGQAWLKDHEAGSGPFKIKRWEPGNLYELEADRNYWRGWQEGGNLTSGIWKVIREAASQRLALQKGEVHIALELQPEDMDLLKTAPGVVLIEEPEFRTFSVKMNTRRGYTKDINVRKAISYAFDYEAMIAAQAGHARLMVGPLPHGMEGHDPTLSVPRTDLARAKEYLARSPWPNGGFRLEYTWVTGIDFERKLGLILLNSLKKLNIDLDIKPLVWPDMVARAKTPETCPDFFPVYQTANYGDPDNIAFAAYHSSQNGSWSNPTYGNPKTDELIVAGRSILDKERRRRIYLDFQRQVIEDAPDLFGVLENRKLGLRADVQGHKFIPLSSNAIDFYPLGLK